MKKSHTTAEQTTPVDREPVGYRKNWPHVVARTAPSPSSTEDRTKRLEQLSPIIHDLLAWELVVRTDSGEFVLCEDVQHRLAETTARQSHPSAAVYVGRPCGHCGATGVTRLIDGVRTCPTCAAAPAPAIEPPIEIESAKAVEPKERSESHSWWARKVG